MGLGWFGLSTFWLLPLVWQTVGRVLAGERRVFGRGSLRVWMGTLLVLGASATLESLTGVEGETAGGAVGHAMAGMASGMLGWTGALLMMLAVLGMAAPMVFGETWRSLFLLRRPRADGDEARADARPPSRANTRMDARANTRVDARVEPRPESRAADTAMPQASPRDSVERWETTSPPGQSNGGWQPSQPRHKGIEAVSARRQPAWQPPPRTRQSPPPRTRQSPPQPGEIWLHHAEAPGAVKPAQATSPAVTPAPKATVAAATPRAATPPAPSAPSAPKRPAPAAPAQARAETPPAPKPAAARATVVSSPFRNPQLGLRSAITTLPEAKAASVAGQAASATAAVAVASAEAVVEEIETIDGPIAGQKTDAPAEAAVTMDAIREEAMALLAELRALAGRPVEAASVAESAEPAEPAEPVALEELVSTVEPVEPVDSAALIESDADVELVGQDVEVLDAQPEPVTDAVDAAEIVPDLADEAIQQAVAASMADDAPIEQSEPVAGEALGEDQDKAQAEAPVEEQADERADERADEQADEQAAVVDANAFVQPAPKPRIVLQAVVGKTVALGVPASAASPAVPVPVPVPVAVPPAPPRIVDYRLPGAGLLEQADENAEQVSEERLQQTGELIAQRLAEFKVPVSVVGASAGPVITRFEVDPAMGVRGAQVVGLMKDLARALGVTSIRVVETIPGKTCMGLELPNPKRQMIRLSEIVNGSAFQAHASKLVLAMGKDITGNPVVTDLARAPHLLVAGTTGSGKSVAVNAMILSMLYKATPEDVRLIMIDPKMLELSVYEGIPHLLAPVVTDMKQAAHALNWCVGEMEKRYRLMSALGVRNLAGYNQKIRAAEAAEQKVPNPFSLTPDAPEPLSTLPLIVVVIDELADLMMVAGKKIEELIARLAQKARAAGIHLILATQRPSVDVITGLIKANIPTRVAFQVSSKIDSRTILDQMGAESLLGQGDMLFLPPGTGYPQRVHGAFVADDEVHRVVEHWKQFGEPDYDEAILAGDTPEAGSADLFGDGGGDGESDPLYDEAAQFVLTSRRASISAVQRQLRIGYNRAARLIEQMEVAGLVSPMGRNGTREVVAPGPAD